MKEEKVDVVNSNQETLVSTSNYKVGQKFPTPSPGNGDRVFYETLLKQRPDSEMAQEFCIQYGVLPWDDAEKLYSEICRRKGRSYTPIKLPKASKKK